MKNARNLRGTLRNLALAIVIVTTQNSDGSSAIDAVQRLNRKIAVESVKELSPARLAGKYTSTPEELGRRVGPFLSGEELYLFPDGTYIYCEWSDIGPLTIYDKGTWQVTEGVLELKTSSDVTWTPEGRFERRYATVHRKSRPHEVLLIGLERDLPYFEHHAEDDPEFMLLVVAKARSAAITASQTVKLRSKLIRDAWRPEFFATWPAERKPFPYAPKELRAK